MIYIRVMLLKTWQVLNDITGKRKKSELCDTFNINIPTNDAKDINNAFCSYFTNIGEQFASTIGQATSHSSNYLKGNYQNSFFLIPTTPGDIIAIIISFKSKTSSGHDGLSSKLVKDLKYALAFPLSIIINNSLAKRLVPNMALNWLKYFQYIKRRIKRTYRTIDRYLFYRLFPRY